MLCIGVFLWCCVAFQECLFPHWMWFLRCGDDSDGKGLVTQHEHWILDSHYPCKSHCGEVASLKFQLSEGWNIEASFSSQISQTSEFNWESLPQWIQWGATEEGSHYKPLALQASISNFYQCLHTRASVFTHMETCMTYACMPHTQIIKEKLDVSSFLLDPSLGTCHSLALVLNRLNSLTVACSVSGRHFSVLSPQLAVKQALDTSWMNRRKRPGFSISPFLVKKKGKWMLSLTGFCCLMNFPPDPPDQRSVILPNEILQDAHRSCWGWSLSFMRLYQRPSQQGDTATYPSRLQTSCNFYLPSLARPTLHQADIKIQPSGSWWIK